MRSKSMMLILVSLGFGAVATVGMVQVITRSSQSDQEAKVPVLVAMTDLNIKDELTVDNVQIEMFPQSLVPDGVVSAWEEADGKKVLARVSRGMPIMADMIFDKNQVTDVEVPPGYNVIAINVDARDSFFGLLKPGHRVNVIAIRSTGDADVAKTFLRNVLVYAVDDKTDRIEENPGESRNASTVQLVVNERQAEAIALYDAAGRMRLVMSEDSESTEPELVEDTAFTPPPRTADAGKTAVGSLVGAATSWLQTMREQAASDPADSNTETASAGPSPVNVNRPGSVNRQAAANHTMTVMLTNGAVVSYEWADRNQLPTLKPHVPSYATGVTGTPSSVGTTDPGPNSPAPGSSFDYVDDGAE